MSKRYRIGIVGIGAIARMHAKAIGDLPNAELIGGCCRSPERGRAFVAQFGGRWHPSADQLYEAEKPDVVTICTPSGAHLEPAVAAMQRGIAVLCEKPLEITTSRCDQMIAVSQRTGVALGGIFPQRFNPVVQALAEAAAAGRFGNLAVVNSYVPWWRDDAYYAPHRWQGKLALDGGGAMINQSIHGVDAAQWLAGLAMDADRTGVVGGAASAAESGVANPVSEVFAFTAKRGHDPNLIEVEDTAVALLRFRNGALGQLLGATSMFPGSLKRLQIAGRDGTAEILEDELVTYRFRADQPDDDPTRKRFAGRTGHGGGAADPMAIDYANHTRNIAAFLDSLDGKCEYLLTGREARKAVAIIEAVYESARTGRVVKVK